MAPPSEHANRVVARLDGVVALDLEVVAADDIAPGVRELRLAGDLSGFDPRPGQDVMVSVPPGAPTPRFRRYTVRRWDPDEGTVELWVTTSTDGPGAAWAIDAIPGDRIEAVGPRGKIALDEDATTHLFVVDESGLAATCAMAEAVVAPGEVYAFSLLELPPLTEPSRGVEPRYASGVTSTNHVLDPTDLSWVRTVLETTAASLDTSRTAAYAFGELALTREIAGILKDVGFTPARIAVKPYWRDGRANEANGEPGRDVGSE